MKAVCTKDSSHDKFVTTAHVMEEWIVDSCGNFLDRSEFLEVTQDPDPKNYWTCHICGSDAEVE